MALPKFNLKRTVFGQPHAAKPAAPPLAQAVKPLTPVVAGHPILPTGRPVVIPLRPLPATQGVIRKATPARTASATVPATVGAAADSWFFVGRLGDFAGNFPPVDQLRAVGITGVAMQPSDPLLSFGVGEAHRQGFKAMVWDEIGSYNNDPDLFVTALQQAQQATGADAVGLDVETEAKGPPGSDAYKLSAAIAAAARAKLTAVPWSVVPIRSGGDFDFAAYTNAGGTVIVQTYGSDPTRDFFDPVEVVRLAIQSGTPPNRISVLMAPGQATAANLTALRALGITSVSLYRQDGLEVAVANAAGFPVAASSAAAAAAPPESAATLAAAQAAVASAAQAQGLEDTSTADSGTVEDLTALAAIADDLANPDVPGLPVDEIDLGEDPAADAVDGAEITPGFTFLADTPLDDFDETIAIPNEGRLAMGLPALPGNSDRFPE